MQTTLLTPRVDAIARFLQRAEACGRVRWDSDTRSYDPLARATDDGDAWADTQTLAVLLTGLRRRQERGGLARSLGQVLAGHTVAPGRRTTPPAGTVPAGGGGTRGMEST